MTPHSVSIPIGFLSVPTPGSTTASNTPCGMYCIALISNKLPYFMSCGGIPCEMSFTFNSGSILFITPFTTPTDPSSIPKSVAKEIIFFMKLII